jgi:hypothetical protein
MGLSLSFIHITEEDNLIIDPLNFRIRQLAPNVPPLHLKSGEKGILGAKPL